jgi:hypothetical protein
VTFRGLYRLLASYFGVKRAELTGNLAFSNTPFLSFLAICDFGFVTFLLRPDPKQKNSRIL